MSALRNCVSPCLVVQSEISAVRIFERLPTKTVKCKNRTRKKNIFKFFFCVLIPQNPWNSVFLNDELWISQLWLNCGFYFESLVKSLLIFRVCFYGCVWFGAKVANGKIRNVKKLYLKFKKYSSLWTAIFIEYLVSFNVSSIWQSLDVRTYFINFWKFYFSFWMIRSFGWISTRLNRGEMK